MTKDGVLYLVMDLVEGHSLESLRPLFGDAAWALPILRQVTEARGAGVVLDAASVQYNAPQFDVTNEVLQRVNTSIPSVSVTRRPYTECVQQQQQQSSQ